MWRWWLKSDSRNAYLQHTCPYRPNSLPWETCSCPADCAAERKTRAASSSPWVYPGLVPIPWYGQNLPIPVSTSSLTLALSGAVAGGSTPLGFIARWDNDEAACQA
ncbi:hypothetical protein BO94DRAFT_209027 [Aspergillus sclerotioniger CBS 115572]|uniref:Uncharacterized protein n=1 Tax=Aspergillus sclerotioniger CBS 115572 TaxID=1450535 RepID=A0A317VQ93_9EURO|nr:hypothetical protein BO94DRAFT_209027 [Aspergillus sclerotioniger CBS 115572]PWY76115.1 hypothetical protein BO94DRAFT_209027 [Aspergillus sclerotioniger CBS 115572]